MTFKLNAIALSLLSALPLLCTAYSASGDVLQSYNPLNNDNQVGQLNVSGGTTDLTGPQQFTPGQDGAVNTTLGALNDAGRILSGYDDVVDKDRLTIGSRNNAITIPDPTTGGNTTFSVYNTDNLVAAPSATADTTVADIQNVNNEQYINARVANVGADGTLNVDIGAEGGKSTDATNSWSMAAKQSTLFDVNGESGDATLNWNSSNRMTFFGSVANSDERQYTVNNLVTYAGDFTVDTLDGETHTFSVNSVDDLKTYNDWLISQLQTSNLSTSTYVTNFNKAFTTGSATVNYTPTATPPDEVFEPTGQNIFINAHGAGSKVNIAEGATLEVAGANGGLINATAGATVTNDGKIASHGGSALKLDDSTGINNGVINGNFFNTADGTGGASSASGSGPAVNVNNGSTFSNNGVLNLASAGGSTQGINLAGGSSANNSGDINVGINSSSTNGTMSGVLVNDSASSFTNEGSGTIYIGRGPENSVGEGATDTAINQDQVTSGIRVENDGVAVNDGHIVIGSKVQNAAAMFANGGDNTTLTNNGIIDINGAAAAVPNENIGMSVLNAGSGGNIQNNGTINLNGVNATGIKVIAQDGFTANASSTASGVINVAGGSDPSSGTRNFGVWVEGDGSGMANASIDSKINLTGDGAIGVHARGNATVDISSNSVPTFSEGSNQIGFFAFGPNAKINVIGVNDFNVSTTGSTLFRIENGADFDGTGLSLTASGSNSIAVLGSGPGGTEINTNNADIEVTGIGATGVLIEGGAMGTIDSATTMNLTGENSVGAISDGQKHDLAGKNSGNPDGTTSLTSAASLTSTQDGLTGYIARNGAQLTNSGDISFSGANTTGLLVQTGATGNNTGDISINNGGTAIKVDSGSGPTTTANTSGVINVNGGDTSARSRGVSATGATAIANLENGAVINLNGVGAIGAEALSGAHINISATATPVFNNTDQIAYRAVGQNSTITSATSTAVASTARSTIYRIEDAATLALGAGSSLTALADGSQDLVGSGAGTTITANSTSLVASGSHSRAMTIEGGATGTIDGGSTLVLSGEGSIGGIADGQKHDLNGQNVGSIDANTHLNSAGLLTSTGNNVFGYVATNQGNAVNSGTMNMSGSGNVGMQAQLGGNVTNSGNITLGSSNGIGLVAMSDDNSPTTTATNDGAITLSGGSLAQRSQGILATGSKSVANLTANSSLTLGGVGDIGVNALNGAAVNIASGGALTFNNTDQLGFHAQGSGAVINSAMDTLTVNTARSSGYRIDDGALLNFTQPVQLTLSGDSTTGVIASGSNSNFTSGAATFDVSGNGATGSRIEGGATASFDQGSAIHVNGNNSVGVLVNNLATDLNNALNGQAAPASVVSQATVDGSGQNAIAYDLANGATLTNSGAIDLTGSNNIGVRMREGATLNNSALIHVADGTGVDISGNAAGLSTVHLGGVAVDNGIAGVRLSNNAQLLLNGPNDTITTGGTAHGILLDSGAGPLTALNTTLNINGSGNGIENFAEQSNVLLRSVNINVTDGSGIRTATAFNPASSASINVNGEGTGFNFTNADGSVASGDLALGPNYRINVDGSGGVGIHANTTGTVVTATPVNINSADGGAALVAGTAKATLNQGELISQSTQAPVVDLSNGSGTQFENQGTISAVAPTATAIAGSAGADTVLLTGGAVTGDVATGAGDDIVQWTGGTLNGSLTLGDGENNSALVQKVDVSQTSHITSGPGANNQLTLSGISYRGGSFAADDASKGVNLGDGWSSINFVDNTRWGLTDNLKLSHSTVNIDSTSTLLAGNSVNPIIAGGSDGSVVVNNAGLIDLTNGAGSPGNTVTINGGLASTGGRVNMTTNLNQGGALDIQRTDRVLVDGDATGTTLLNVKPSVRSTGALTDLNDSSTVESFEGISLAQVAGNAAGNSFALNRGYLAAGPWRYQLYAFAPGRSDAGQRLVAGSGNDFWDYRLANAYVCQGEESCSPHISPVPPTSFGGDGRRQVIPQVPSYISAITGLAYYNSELIDDLHKRLGEINHENGLPEGNNGEMFLRYVGSSMKYNTNVGFQNFGYNVDMNYNAVQLGGNLLRIDDDRNTWRGGLAYMHGTSTIRPKAVDGYSKTTFDTDSLGVYLTWLRNNKFYVDGVLMFNHHKGHTDIGGQDDVADIKGNSWSASVETGYPFTFKHDIKLEPQAQLMYQKIKMDNFTDDDSTTVDFSSYHQTIGRLGARLDRTWVDEKGRQYTPYLTTSYYKSWGGAPKETIGSAEAPDLNHTFAGGQFGQMWEVGLGGTASFRKDLSLYSEVDYRKEISGNGAKGWHYDVGIRWTF